jgi:copper chaperone CopZ
MKFKYTVDGLDCPNCAAKLAKQIESREGILSCKINFFSLRMTVESELPEDTLYGMLTKECHAFSRDIKLER